MKFSLKTLFLFLSSLLIIFLATSCLKSKNKFSFNSTNPKIVLVLPGSITESLWNSSAFDGLKRIKSDYKNVEIAAVENVSTKESKAIFHALAKQNYDLVIAYGYQYGAVLKKIAPKCPNTFFCVVDGDIFQGQNLSSFTFKDEQFGYLLGVIAGLNTATNKVGIVISRKIPSVERAIIGMREGLRSVNPKADLVISYTKEQNSIPICREAAVDQINTGVDVVTHIVDIGGIGVIKAAEESDISAIGTVTDQHSFGPTTVLASVILDISQIVYLVSELYLDKSLEPAIYRFGLKHELIDITPSQGNIDPTTENTIQGIKKQLAEMESKEEDKGNKKKKL